MNTLCKQTMTLAEYQAQINPIFMPLVKLTPDEYSIIYEYIDYRDDSQKVIAIKIHAYPEHLYFKRGKSNQLWTINKTLSCFWI